MFRDVCVCVCVCKGLPGWFGALFCPRPNGQFLVLGATFKLFQIEAINGGKHIKGGVPKKGIYNQNLGPLSNNFNLEQLLVTAASSM